MNYFLICIISFVIGCASTGTASLFTAKAADKIQVAEKVVGVEKADVKVKVADRAAVVDKSVDNSQANKTSVGGNMTNDSAVITVYIKSYERIIKMLMTIIKIMGGIIASLIALVGWAMKRAMVANESDDRWKEKQLEAKGA